MSYRGPQDPRLRRAWQHERRAEIRQHHPDRGGDPTILSAQLAALDRTYSATERLPDSNGRARVVRRAALGVRRGLRGVRSRIPRSWPGSRRYFDV